MFKKKEKFVREDPKSYSRYYLLRILNWLVPIFVVVIGLFITTQKFAPMMNYDERVIGKPLLVIANYKIYNPGYVLLGLFKYASDKTYANCFFEVFPPTTISIIIAFSLYFITALILNSHQKNQNVYGTATWAIINDLKDTGHCQKYGVVCGQQEKADVYPKINPDAEKANIVLHMGKNIFNKEKIAPLVCHSGALNTWMFAPTGSAKGVGTIIPTCLNYGVPYWAKVSLWENYIKKISKETVKKALYFISPKKKVIKGKRSIVIFDPKGENYAASAGYRSKFSIILPFQPLNEDGLTAHYNPITEIPENQNTAFAWADMIGEIFFGNEKKGGGGDATSEYFANKARDIFTAVVLHVRFAPEDKIPWKEKNMSKILSFMSEASHDGKTGYDASDEENESCGEAMLAEMIATDHGYEEINDIIRKAAYRSKTQPAKERGSTYSTIFSKISLFQDPLLAKATAYSDFSVDDFINGKNPISLYLIVPYNHIARIAPVFRMLITFMIKKFSDGTTNANEVKLKNPCLFLLDEFPVLGYFPDIAQNMGVLRGYGVTFFIVSQSKKQMADIYGENHAFFGHCKTKIVYAPNELSDAKEISEILGTRSVLLDNKSSNMGNLSASSLSSQEISVSLMNADELMKLDYSRNIILMEGKPAYRGKKVVYYEDPRFKDKAFMELPKFAYMQRMWKTLPSNRIVRKPISKTPKEIVQGIDIQNVITSDFDVFVS